MNVRDCDVLILLSEEGHDALQVAIQILPETRLFKAHVEDTDEIGVWVQVARPDGIHVLLVRWEYRVTMDLVPSEPKIVGVRP